MGSRSANPGAFDVGMILDVELVYRETGLPYRDDADTVSSLNNAFTSSAANATTGSFLVRTSVVPIPAAVWLFGSALAGLGWYKRKSVA